ncbi:DMT family transporter [uncultured Ferrovibrio sp.]|uniref:DMT family transporter n=1 Tax=uncultured Ferrovibrio sp. TaxID=1576913 RepID=UPI002638CF70|nr:DMT family transporter [uncultured Ferrovibrio sp.]
MLLICAIWGYNFVASKIAVSQFPPVFFTGLRFLGLALLMIPWLKWQKGQMKLVLPSALLMGTLHFALMFNGIALADDVSVVAVVVQLGVPISTLMAWAMLGERVRWKRGLGIALAFLGTMIISFDPRVFSYKGAILYCLGSVFAMSYGQILVRRIQGVDTFTMQAWVGAISGPSLLLISFLVEDGQMQSAMDASWVHWGMVAYAVLGVSLIGHGGAYFLLRRYPVSIVNPGFTLAPILGIVSGIVFLGERLSERVLIGAALTLVGVLIVTLREAKVAEARGALPEEPAVKPEPNRIAGE